MTWRTFPPVVPDAESNPARPVPSAKTLDDLKADAAQKIAASRYALETAGIDFYGTRIKTDRESQATLNAAMTAVSRNPLLEIDWKGDNGWVKLGKAEVEAISDAVIAHVQACFSSEKNKLVALGALTTAADVRAFDCEVTL